MKISALPETPIRLVGKKFRTLYHLVDKLNHQIEEAELNSKIEMLQIFFNTVVPLSNNIEILRLRDGILQVVLPFNWDEFSKLDSDKQQIQYVQLIQKVVNLVITKYKLEKVEYDSIFERLYRDLDC